MPVLIAAISGILFGLGLAISGMTNPLKVISFLNPIDGWDPSLALVMGAALVVFGIGFRLAARRSAPLFEDKFHLPTRSDLDKRLIIGAMLFGIGWGIYGLCPGPAISTFLVAPASSGLFTVAMLVGFVVARRLS